MAMRQDFTLASALKALGAPGEKQPVEAIDWLLANWEAARPALSLILARCARDGERASDGDWASAYVAMLMFAEKRDAAGSPLLRALLRQPETFEAIYFDDGSKELTRVMISIFDGDAAALRAVADDEKAEPFAREAAFETIAYHTAAGAIDRGETVAWLRDFGARLRGDAAAMSEMWPAWAFAVANLGVDELMVDVRESANPEEQDDVELIEEVERAAAIAREEPDPLTVFAGEGIGPIEGARAELDRVEALHEHWERTLAENGEGDGESGHEPVVNEFRDVGRNDPCPCGSGKKFKKCCLAA